MRIICADQMTDECAESLACMPYMDGGSISFKVGLTKPDPRMFRCFLERFELRQGGCMFVDDTEENVTAARHWDFRASFFQTYDAPVAEFRKADAGIDV